MPQTRSTLRKRALPKGHAAPAMEPLEARLLLDATPLITEFLAINDTPVYPANPDSDWDWIEIYNPTTETVNLEGWHLTDNRDDLTKWTFPAGTSLDPDAYRIVFASGLEAGDPAHPGDLHADFKLSGDDPEYLGLVMPDGTASDIVHEYAPTYPPQVENVSYGLPGATVVWEDLVSAGDALTYHVPTPGEDVLEWTAPGYDDSGWVDTLTLDTAGVVVTEVSTGDTKFVEIQNVIDQPVDTTGWSVLVNDTSAGHINDLHAAAWSLPASVAAGEVLYRTDDPGDAYWGSTINWDADGPGWVMILDSGGAVIDFVAWGYTAAEIASLSLDYGAFTGITIGDAWSGDGADVGSDVPGGTGEPTFTAFNDHVAGGGTHANTTTYAANGAGAGLLKDSTTGAGTGVTLTTSQAGVYYGNTGSAPSVGTDAYDIFNGCVDFRSGTGTSLEIETGDSYTHAFTGLDTGQGVTYTFAGTAIRGNGGYTNRWTLVTLQDADAATPAHSTGIGVVVVSPNQVAIWTGDNSAAGQGFVAAWTDIDPGMDGDFSVISTHYTGATPGVGSGTADGSKGYGLAGIRLQEVPPSGPPAWLQRTGAHDGDTAGDFVRVHASGMGVTNPGLSTPFATSVAATTGIGFSENQPQFEANIQTDVYDAMYGAGASLWTRITFEASQAGLFDVLTLRMKYDAGFVAYLNGVPIAARNNPDPLQYDSAATDERTDEQAVAFEDIDVSDYLTSLQVGTNVLAIHGMNSAAADADFLILPEMTATSTLEGPQYMLTPTRGAANLEGALGLVADTRFTADRGFYDEPFDVAITTETSGTEIFYTTDGSKPHWVNTDTYTGPISEYAGPIHIGHTTTLRAVATRPGYIETNIDTHTYLFVDDVVKQDYQATLDAGLPTMWGGTSPDYGMDPDVIGTFDVAGDPNGDDLFGGVYAATIKDDLKSLPTLSIVMNIDEMFGSSGIYTNSGGHGIAYERETSAELIYPDGITEGFQVDCGIRIQGGAFRSHGLTKKHSLRLLFKDDYGPTKLRYPLFGDDAVDSFDTVTLRAGANDGYTWDAAKYTEQYIRDQFGRNLQEATGNAASHGTFVHLYINGIYWGLYNPVERPDDAFSASYYGGEKEDWDSIHDGGAAAGSTAAWSQMISKCQQAAGSTAAYMELQAKDPDGTPNSAYPHLLDVPNYVDYLIVNVWGGNWDWPWKNWWAGRDRTDESTGFKFYNWDYENTMGNNLGRSPLNKNALNNNFSSAGQPHQNLKQNAEYRLLFADRIHRYFFNDGLLTPDSLIPRYSDLADQVERSIVAESARWGDTKHSTPLTLDDWYDDDGNYTDGRAGRDWILNYYLPQRTDIVLAQFIAAGLYPTVTAPTFNQHGGEIASGFSLTMDAPAGNIYYTTDGTDPRLVGGATSPAAQVYGSQVTLTRNTNVKARVYSGGTWSALAEATFVLDTLPDLVVTEVMYHPAAATPAEIAAGFTDRRDFEFIEFQNIGTEPINLVGLRFFDGVDFAFPTHHVAPGEYVLVVSDQEAFQFRYPTVPTGLIAGEFKNRTVLDDAGETIGFETILETTIQEFEPRDGWFDHTDGLGFSLVVRDPLQDPLLWNSKDGWRASWLPGGNPGAADPGLVNPGDVVINEVLAHSDGGVEDWIELHNTTADSHINITGWFLSDTDAQLDKFALPATILGPGDYAVFNQVDHFGGAFALKELGDEVYLTSAAGGVLAGYREDEFFGASDNDVSFGRYVKSTGAKDFVAMTDKTYETVNAAPLIPDVVLNEIMYHPELGGHEYIELYNRTGAAVPLHDSEPTPNSWQFTGGVVYTFPADASIPAYACALVVGIDPGEFRATYGIDPSVTIYGPWDGALANEGERLELSRPGTPEPDGFVPYVATEKVTYNDADPWPLDADGTGPSLERIVAGDYGNDILNWAVSTSAGGTPGAANSGLPPQVTAVDLNPDPGRAARSVGAIDPSGLGVETVVVTFSKDVTFAPEDVVAEKVTFDTLGNQTSAVGVAPAGVYGSGTDEMIITFADSWQQMVDTWVRITLADTITDASAQGLDGEPAADSSGLGYIYDSSLDLPSGNGAAGGEAVFYVGSLRADMRGFGPIAEEPNGTVDSWDITGFTQKYLAGDLDADFRGFGPTAEEPNGAVDSWDINGFTSRYTAALAAGTHLNDLPTSGGPLATGAPSPLPLIATAAPPAAPATPSDTSRVAWPRSRGHVLDGLVDNMATDHPVAMPPAHSSPAAASPTEPGAEAPGHVPHPAVPIAGTILPPEGRVPWPRSRSHVLDTTADTGLVDLLAAPALAVSLGA